MYDEPLDWVSELLALFVGILLCFLNVLHCANWLAKVRKQLQYAHSVRIG